VVCLDDLDIADAVDAHKLCGGGMPYLLYAMKVGDCFKFGITRNLKKRLSSIQACCPTEVEVIGSVWATEDVESEVHRYLIDDHVRGEWFRITRRSKDVALKILDEDLSGLLKLIGWFERRAVA
jgi:hypothetical protein